MRRQPYDQVNPDGARDKFDGDACCGAVRRTITRLIDAMVTRTRQTRSARPATAARIRHDDTPSAASSQLVRVRMQAQRTRDTAPELAVRRLLHARGLRYRVDEAVLPGVRRRADVVFRPTRVAVFIDGCFWHGCPVHGTQPRTNAQWWDEKLRRNQSRDLDTDDRLREAGWAVVRIWEHVSPDEAAASIAELVSTRSRRSASIPARTPTC